MSKKLKLFYIVFILLFSCITLKSRLSYADRSMPRKYYPVSFVFENDLFAQTDNGYTNGVVLSISSPWYRRAEHSPFDKLFDLASRFTLIGHNIHRQRVNFAVGQSIFTPDDIKRKDLIQDDMPYSGLFFGRVSIDNENTVIADSVSLVIGIVGPTSLAEETQKGLHALTGNNEPQGWSHQLKDEPVLNVSYRFKWKPYSEFVDNTTCKMEFMPYTDFSFGNLITGAKAGVIFRVGEHVDSFGSSISLGGIHSLPDIGDKPLPFTWFFFTGVEVSYTAYMLHLDGNTFKDSHSVDRIPDTATLSSGLVIGRGRYRLGFYMARGTKTFEKQDGCHSYGSVTLGYLF